MRSSLLVLIQMRVHTTQFLPHLSTPLRSTTPRVGGIGPAAVTVAQAFGPAHYAPRLLLHAAVVGDCGVDRAGARQQTTAAHRVHGHPGGGRTDGGACFVVVVVAALHSRGGHDQTPMCADVRIHTRILAGWGWRSARSGVCVYGRLGREQCWRTTPPDMWREMVFVSSIDDEKEKDKTQKRPAKLTVMLDSE